MPVIDQTHTDRYSLWNSDTMEVLPKLPDDSIDLSVYSPPFPELYQYSDDPRDVTNCVNYEEALKHLGYVVEQVSRVLKPGRLTAVHCTDLKWGSLFQRDFPGDVIRMHEKHGLRFFCRVTIWREAWEFARRTRMKTLMHKSIVADSAQSRIAPADYIVIFIKSGENAVPITHERGFKHYAGGKLIPAKLRDYLNYRGEQKGNSLSHWIYRQYASPVWMDIRRGRLLPFNESKENPEERHVCPLQLDTIERCLVLWSNPGETVLTPFAGIGSELWMSVRLGRKAIGAELKASYYRQAIANMEMVDRPEDGDLKFAMGDGIDGMEEDDDSADHVPSLLDGLTEEKPPGYWTNDAAEAATPDPIPVVPDLSRDRPGPKRKGRKPAVHEPALPGL